MEQENFTKRMRRETRDIHAISDALVNAKLAFSFSDNSVWADGLLVFYEIFRYLEEAMERLKTTKVGLFRLDGLQRTKAFEEDLQYYLGNDWKKNYDLRVSVIKYLMRLREIEDTNSLLLIVYIYHLYMGLLSGGTILSKKQQLVHNVNPFKKKQTNPGNALFNFGEHSIHELKSGIKDAMNKIAETLDEATKNQLIEESKTVFEMNNEIIRSVKGTGIVVIRKCAYIFIVIVILIMFLHFLKQ